MPQVFRYVMLSILLCLCANVQLIYYQIYVSQYFFFCSAIKRIIFYSVMKPMMNDKGEIEMDLISTSQALQIAGRAGRYNTVYEHGEVTTFYSKDLHILKDIVKQPIEPVMVSLTLSTRFILKNIGKECSVASILTQILAYRLHLVRILYV